MSFFNGDLIYSYEVDHDEYGIEILKHEIKAKVIGLDAKGTPLVNIISGGEYLGNSDRGRRFVRVGNTSVSSRQNGIYYDAITEDNPRIVIYDGVDRFSKLFAHPTKPEKMFVQNDLIRAQIGNLGSINDPAFGGWLTDDQTENGKPLFGMYSDNVFLKGNIIIANPEAINSSDLTNDAGWTNDTAALAAQAVADDAHAIATAAQLSADKKIITFYQPDLPTAEGVGDLWIDTNNGNKLARWDGAGWVDVQDQEIQDALTAAGDAQSTADRKIITYLENDPPTAEGVGDLWIDTNNGNKLSRWSGSNWVYVQDQEIQDALLAASNAQTTADRKIITFFENDPPTAEGVGDLWIDTNNGNKLARWDGAGWVDVQDQEIQDALTAAGDAQSTADRKIITFLQDEAPTAEDVGDLWIDTNDGNRLFRWDGAGWVDVQDQKIQNALDAAAAAQSDATTALSTANSKINTFYQTDEPTGGTYVIGDMWVDTDDNNHLYRWNGTSWLSARDETANWNFLGNIPSQLSTPSGDGIYISATHMGFYSGGAWKTYINNSGYFYFDGDATNFISWNGSELDIRGKLNADDITSGTLTGRTIRTSVNNPKVELDSISNSLKIFDSLSSIKTQLGNLGTINDPAFGGYLTDDGTQTGNPFYGLYSDNVFLKGKILITNPGDINTSDLTNGAGWTNDDAALAAQEDATNALTAVATKIQTYYQTDEPTGGTYTTGDMWVETDNNNLLHVWNGTAWESVGNEITDWNQLGNIPSPLTTPSGSGLFIADTHMGYYSGGAWKTYIQNNGYFYFDGDATNFISWNGSALDIRGKLNADDITSGVLTGRTIRTSAANPRVEIESASNSMKVYDNLGTVKTVVGDLSSVTDPEFGTLTGLYGLYSDSIYLNVSQQGKFLIKKDDNNFFNFDPTNFEFKSESFSLTSANLGIYSGADAKILIGDKTDYNLAKIGFLGDGSGKLANGNINWNIQGEINFGNDIKVTGDITMDNGKIWTSNAGVGASGFVIDKDGIRGYGSSPIGLTFNLPTNGDAPIFSSGIIRSTVFEIYESSILRTSEFVGIDPHYDAGLLINDTGLYVCEQGQTLVEANVKINTDGTFRFGDLNGHKIEWDGSSLVVTGNINIQNQDAIDTNNITDGANLGKTSEWANISVPATPSKMGSDNGLFLDSTHLGYYFGMSWVTYMDNQGNFACGVGETQGLEWDQTAGTLTVSGSINIVNPGTAFNGNQLSTNDIFNEAGWTNDAAANAAQGTANAAQSAATVNATKIMTDENGKLVTSFVDHPQTAGLHLYSDHLGFHNGNGSSSGWKTYMDDNGNFYLSGSGSHNLSWNGSTLAITGSIVIQSGSSGYGSLTDKPNQLSEINSSEGIKLSGIADNADVTQTTIDGGLITTGYIDLDDDGNIRSGMTSYNDTSNSGFWLGSDGVTTKFKIRNSSSKYFQYDGSDFKMVGGNIEGSTITGGIVQTSESGERVKIDGDNNRISFYDLIGDRVDLYGSYGAVWVDGKFASAILSIGGVSDGDFYVSGGEILTVDGKPAYLNNGKFLRSNGDSYTPSLIQVDDLPIDDLFITENKLWYTGGTATFTSAKIRTVVNASLNYVGSNFSNIAAGSVGQELVIIRTNSGTGVTFDETGNLKLSSNYTMYQWDTLKLVYDGTNWIEISRSNN